MSYLLLGCRALLAGVFLWSLAGKLRGRAAFRGYLDAARTLLGLPERRSRPLAACAVLAEAAAVVLLVVLPPLGFVVAGGLLACFTAALVRALRRDHGASCPCFGASSAPVGRHHVARNAVLGATAALGLALSVAGTGGYRPGGVAVTAFAVLVCVLVTARLDDLAALFRRP